MIIIVSLVLTLVSLPLINVDISVQARGLFQADIEKQNITAPVNGRVAFTNIHTGNTVVAGETIFTMDAGGLEAQLSALESIHNEHKRSIYDANFEYTPEALAYIQSQMYFVESSIKESKNMLGIDQFQTRKCLAWQHQVALNFLVSSFVLKEKLLNFQTAPLLSARDIKEMLVFKLYKKMTEEQMQDRIFNRHLLRQQDINMAFKKQLNLSK